MNTRYYIDTQSGEPHIYRHGISEVEVDEALRAAGEDRPGLDGCRIAIGRTDGGRYLRIVYVPGP